MTINKYENAISVTINLFTNTSSVQDSQKIIASISIFLYLAVLRRKNPTIKITLMFK